VSFFDDFGMSCTALSSAVSAQSATELPSIQQINSSYEAFAFGGREPYSYQWTFDHDRYAQRHKTVEYQFQETGNHSVTLNIMDNDGYSEEFSVNVSVVNLSASFNHSGYSSFAGPPGEEINFTDTSAVADGYQMMNWTWDFGDGTRSYVRNASHVYLESGVYNVSLTVLDNQSNTDVSSQFIHVFAEESPPQIQQVTSEVNIDDRWLDVALVGFFDDPESGINYAFVNITSPDGTHGNYTMEHVYGTVYCYIFNDTDSPGQYNYTIWVMDNENNTNSSTGYFFTIPMPPVLLYSMSTPANNTSTRHPWADINVTILDTLNTSAFIDWDRSLKGYWPMDTYNTTGFHDNSTYNNFGRFEHGMTTTNIKNGRYGKAVEFDGIDDDIDLGTNDSLDLGTGNFTFMVWENSDQASYVRKAVILTNRPDDASAKGYCFGVQNKSYLYVTQSSGSNVTLNGNADVTDHVWHHLAFVRRGTNYSIYVDGAYDAGVAGAVKNITNNQHTYLAFGRTGNYLYFDGLLDEPQLYNRALSLEEIKASYNNGLYWLYHNFTGLSDGVYNYYAHAIDTSGNQSTTETRQITIDTTPPSIANMNASPHTIGFGFNVTITADVVDNESGVDLVTVQIMTPSGAGNSSNHTMSLVANDTYQYIFPNTWLTGQYNYTVWATDHANNTGSSNGHHFHVSASATIGIATLKDSYSGNQYINITDPPENLTLISRGLTWNTYYNATSGDNILEAYQGPVNYQDDNDTWVPINTSLASLTPDHPAYDYGYRTGNDRGLFGVYFKSNVSSEWPVAFSYNRSDDPTTYVMRSKLVGVGYVDPASDWAYQYLQNVQSSQGQTSGNSITYPGVFTGTDVTWHYGNTELKEAITMSNTTKTLLQNHPPHQYGLHDVSSYLVFITKLDHRYLDLYNASGMLSGNVTISDTGVDFKDALGQFKCGLPLGDAYELNNESVRQMLTYRIIHYNGDTYLLSGVKVTALSSMTFPVVIDPTLTVYSISSDGFIYSSGSNYNTVRTASTGTVNSSGTYLTIGQKKSGSTYYIYRGFVFFNTSTLPSNAYLDNATLSLYKKDDYSTTDFVITIQNGQPTYPHKPMLSVDYNKNFYSGNGGTLPTQSFTNGYNAIILSNLSWINKTGITKLCLRSDRDINGIAPTGNEYVNVYANEKGSGYQPKLVINYRNQSKIKNTGTTDIKGYLLIQVQFYNTSQGKWLVDQDTINETSPRTIIHGATGAPLALDMIFNGHVRVSDLTHGTGTYRVYTAFSDPEGNILKTNSGVELKAWWQFTKT
jgi:PKD repeat protein